MVDDLFAGLDDEPPNSPAAERREWTEVPQALFLSWSPAMQHAYCAARDEANALADDVGDEEMAWLLERAMGYTRMIK